MTDPLNTSARTGQKTGAKGGLVLSVRRAALASSVAIATLGGAVMLGDFSYNMTPAQAELRVREPSVAAPSFADVVETVRPAVVSVRVRGERQNVARLGDDQRRGGHESFPDFRDLPEDHPLNRFFREFGPQGPRGERGDRAPRRGPRQFGMGQGSGFLISDDGYIVTNNHVIDGGSDITVVLDNGDVLDAELVGTDPRTDLAVLKVEADREFDYVEFSGDDIRVGDWVVTMGNPFGLGGTVTAGIVSARGRDIGAGPYDDFLQIDAAVNRGNSGGPAFSLDGRVVGINTAIFSPNGGNVGIAFAIPAGTARDVVTDLIENGSVTRGWLGVQIQPVTPDIAESLGLDEARGAIVADVTADSPAEAAGLETGDTVVAVNGEAVEDPKDLARRIANIEPDETAEVELWRDGRKTTVDVRIGTLPKDPRMASADVEGPEAEPTALAQLGLDLDSDADEVVVTAVDPDSEAARKGVREGDRIVEVNGEAVRRPGDVAEGVKAAEEAGRKAVLVLVKSGERSRFIALELKDA